MFVKHCPDPALASILKFKTAEKWTANEIQEHLTEHQREERAKCQAKLGRPSQVKRVGDHLQTPTCENEDIEIPREFMSEGVERTPSSLSQTDGNCVQSLISLLDRVLEQRTQSAVLVQPSRKPTSCKVCKSTEHITVFHCRQEGLCLCCFKSGHWKKQCWKWKSKTGPVAREAPKPHSSENKDAQLN